MGDLTKKELVLSSLEQASEIIKHSSLIVVDMYNQRGEYNSKDLGWRCIDVTRANLKAVEAILETMRGFIDMLPDKPIKSVKGTTAEVKKILNSEGDKAAKPKKTTPKKKKVEKDVDISDLLDEKSK